LEKFDAKLVTDFNAVEDDYENSVALAWGHVPPPNHNPARSYELPKSEKKKLEVGWVYRIILAKQTMLKCKCVF